ncbi:MAG: hypothetical protein D3906_06165, partial [Candidatus Electrothrix sp. AUS1_2]|nr:hypothetical protein [Candidatus Electrothrix sp. AUS1_2]
MKNKFIFILFIFFVGGCSTVEQKVKLKEPSTLPVKRNTILTDQLGCFGDMLADYSTITSPSNRVRPLTISIINIKDATGISSSESREIPPDMTDIAVGVASNIGGPLRIAHIPSVMEIQDMAYASHSSQIHDSYLGNFKFKHYKSDILLYGALTEYDRVISNKKTDYNLGAEIGGGSTETDINLSSSSIANLARLTMDFRVVYTITGNVANNASSTNTIYVSQSGKDFSLGLGIDGQAIGIAKSYTEVDARHAAIRLLVEFGLIESIGKFAEVPYWKCFSGIKKSNAFEIKDQDLINKVKMNYEFGQYLDYSTPDLYPASSDLLNLPRKENPQAIGFFALKDKKENGEKNIAIKSIEFSKIQ